MDQHCCQSVDWETKGRILGVVDRIEGTFAEGGVETISTEAVVKLDSDQMKREELDEWKQDVQVTEVIVIFGFEALAGKGVNVEDNNWSLARDKEERVYATINEKDR